MSLQRFLAASEVLGEREVGIIAATAELARDGYILEPSGIDLTAYRSNPIVLWSHQPEQPVGACTAIAVEGKTLAARVQFAPEGASGVADEICSLAKAGIVRGVSIGFNIVEADPLDPSRGSRGGLHITASELFEISFVSIPADTGARVVARSFASVPGARALLRSLPAVGRGAVDRIFDAMATRRVPPGLLSPNQQFELERQRTMTAWAIGQEREAARKARLADVEQLQAVGESYDAPRH